MHGDGASAGSGLHPDHMLLQGPLRQGLLRLVLLDPDRLLGHGARGLRLLLLYHVLLGLRSMHLIHRYLGRGNSYKGPT